MLYILILFKRTPPLFAFESSTELNYYQKDIKFTSGSSIYYTANLINICVSFHIIHWSWCEHCFMLQGSFWCTLRPFINLSLQLWKVLFNLSIEQHLLCFYIVLNYQKLIVIYENLVLSILGVGKLFASFILSL